ncbi:MAG: hypothetical protein ACUVQI_09215 [Thermochromatium sp.]
MKGRNTLLILVATSLLASLPVQAQPAGPPGPRFDDRLVRQSEVIRRGLDSGELTRREARILQREQDEVRQFMHDLRRDGYPPHEAWRLIDRRLDNLDRHIRDLSSNRTVAPHYQGGPPPRDPPPRNPPPR